MTNSPANPAVLREAIAHLRGPGPDDAADYRIALALGRGFLARARSGAPALLIPLEAVPAAAGRRGGGFSLSPVVRVAFEHDGRKWEQAAATLECTEIELLDTFLVLVVDVARRLGGSDAELTWAAVLACVDEWQALLTRRGVMTIEQQLGLWAELRLISIASDPDRLFAGWRGPEREATDFFLDGIGLEVKASRQRHVHHVSLRQADAPVGEHEAYVLSMWIAIEPGRGVSLAQLVDEALTRVADAVALLKHVALAGYVPADREQYATRFVVLEMPRWFRADDIPRVRVADPRVSQIRYVVTLDPERAVTADAASLLWYHFCRAQPPTFK